jgi:hypothetical protein
MDIMFVRVRVSNTERKVIFGSCVVNRSVKTAELKTLLNDSRGLQNRFNMDLKMRLSHKKWVSCLKFDFECGEILVFRTTFLGFEGWLGMLVNDRMQAL